MTQPSRGRMVIPLVTAAGLALMQVSDVGEAHDVFGPRTLATEVVWYAVAALIAVGAIGGVRRPALWGLAGGAAAVGAAALLLEVLSTLRWGRWASMYKDHHVVASTILLGLCVITAAVASTTRSARSPLSNPRFAAGSGVAGAAVVAGLMVPGTYPGGGSSDFKAWNFLARPGIDTLGWFVALGVLGGCLIVGALSRSFWGRCLAAGAAGPVVLAVVLNFLGDNSSNFYLFTGWRGSTSLLVASLSVVGLLIAAQVTATEIVADVEPKRATYGFVTSENGAAPGYMSNGPNSNVAPTAYAAVGARFGGLLIDGFISFVFILPGYAVLAGSVASGGDALMVAIFLSLMGDILYITIYCRRVGRRGQSWGHQAAGVRVVDARTGGVIGPGRAFGRLVVRGLAAIPCYVGLFWALWDPRRRGWHDMATGTVVIPASAPFALTQRLQSVEDMPAPPPPPPPPPPPAPFSPPLPPLESAMPLPTSTAEVTAVRWVGASPARPGVALEFDDGSRLALDGTMLIGRDPSAMASDAGARIVALDDPTMSVSKTHLAIGVGGGAVWAEDRHSTNGVMLTTHEGEQVKLMVGRRVRLEVGARLSFGDRFVQVVGA